ncbi:hypothetical protein EDD22DRAFT_892880 [Suillus occidentalis]|nr:hypothetical protein EDD22DRAFT_892880 [Suillus occidentalis]
MAVAYCGLMILCSVGLHVYICIPYHTSSRVSHRLKVSSYNGDGQLSSILAYIEATPTSEETRIPNQQVCNASFEVKRL